jgi:tetratricopeptide (TPR) repeat protein
MNPIEYTINLDDFDYRLIACDREGKPEKVREAVANAISGELQLLGGDVNVSVNEKEIRVRWVPVSKVTPEKLIEYAILLLKNGHYRHGIPIMEALSNDLPENFALHFNLGMALSDRNDLDKALAHLQKSIQINPGASDAWNALAVALQRKGDNDSAMKCLLKSHEIAPDNPYTLKNLGRILGKTDPAKALPYFEKAARTLANDQDAQYNCGQCLFTLDKLNEADAILGKAIALNPETELAELCRELKTKIAHLDMRKPLGKNGLQPDAVKYCFEALRKFSEVGDAQTRRITFEIAVLGRSGFDIRTSEQKYMLKNLPGNFSALQLISYMYVGFKKISPDVDAGFDLSKEYEAALAMFKSKDK